jgi:mono/diheme cytochrome c family protein
MERKTMQALRNCLLVLALYGGLAAPASAQPGRGELLYSTFCIGCHTEQVHWREKQLAANWTGLVAEVQRWQANAKLEWPADDVEAVARYLNELHYHHPVP